MDNLRYVTRRERRLRKNGAGAGCVVCGESRAFAVQRFGPEWRCYEHLFFDDGRETEMHHLAGLSRGPVFPIPGNLHRVLTEKTLGMLPGRFLARDRSPEEEMISTIVGVALLSDGLFGSTDSPFRTVLLPPGTNELTVRPAESPHFVHVFRSDESYYRADWHSPFRRLG